ncbi:MAG: hypothetical protein IKO10_19140 [Lachnospiraceae bacterium]|nr:hypothetical protein [Lachnospiraceae bacterium]
MNDLIVNKLGSSENIVHAGVVIAVNQVVAVGATVVLKIIIGRTVEFVRATAFAFDTEFDFQRIILLSQYSALAVPVKRG